MNIQKTIKNFSWTYFINVVGGALVNNVYILLMSTVKQFSDEQVSLIMGMIPLFAIPAVFLWGKILDKSKALPKWAAFIILLNGLSLLGLYSINDFALFFAVALLRTVLVQPLGSICEEYMINITKKAEIPYGKVRRVGTIAAGLTGLIGPLILMFVEVKGVMLVGIVITLISSLLFYFLPTIRLEDVNTTDSGEKLGFLHLMKNKRYVMSLLIIALTYGALNSSVYYGNQTMLIKLNCPETIILAIPVILMLFEMIILSISHRFKVEQKPYRAFLIGTLIMCVRWVLLMFSTHYSLVLMSTLLQGFIVGLTLPAQNYMIAEVVPEKERSTAYLLSIVMQVSVVPGILNLFIGNTLSKLGTSVFGFTYLVISVFALMMIVPMLHEERKHSME